MQSLEDRALGEQGGDLLRPVRLDLGVLPVENAGQHLLPLFAQR
jgi:hypothetical protein